ncbi:MAG: hypothetical protein MUC32_04385 [Burkholderiaceae bacterium]|nr:hypothetical protein [Burkholderiaceae bacterium]
MSTIRSFAAALAAVSVVPALGQTNTAPPTIGPKDLADAGAAWVARHPVPEPEWPGYARIVTSPYTLHFDPSPEHEYVWGIGMEWQRPDNWMFGLVYFSNSFGQPSTYLYGGQRYYNFLGRPKFFLQWTAGVLYGYVDEYEDKVPFNYDGFSPGVVLSAGWQFDRNWSAQLNLLGNAGLMLQISYDLR